MREPVATDLERALSAVAADVSYPPTPPIAPAVTARLSAARRAGVRPPLPGLALWTRRRVFVAVALGILALLAIAAATRLAIGAFEIRVRPALTTTPSSSPIGPGDLGDPTTLAEAERAAGFVLATPTGPAPDDVYVIEGPTGGAGVAAIWRSVPSSPFPSIGGTAWSLILIAVREDAELAVKSVGRFEDVREASLDGRPAFWLPVPHELSLQTDAGVRTYAVLGNVLIWGTAEGITYRLETALPRADAIALAETIG